MCHGSAIHPGSPISQAEGGSHSDQAEQVTQTSAPELSSDASISHLLGVEKRCIQAEFQGWWHSKTTSKTAWNSVRWGFLVLHPREDLSLPNANGQPNAMKWASLLRSEDLQQRQVNWKSNLSLQMVYPPSVAFPFLQAKQFKQVHVFILQLCAHLEIHFDQIQTGLPH